MDEALPRVGQERRGAHRGQASRSSSSPAASRATSATRFARCASARSTARRSPRIGLGSSSPKCASSSCRSCSRLRASSTTSRNKLDADIRKKFEEKGYVLLGVGRRRPRAHLLQRRRSRAKPTWRRPRCGPWVDDPLVRDAVPAARPQRRAARRARRAAVAADGPDQRLLRLAAVDAGAAVVHQGQVHDLDAHHPGDRRHRHHQEGVRQADARICRRSCSPTPRSCRTSC